MPSKGGDVFRPVTFQVQEDFKVETGRIQLHFITKDKFMPVSHNLWPVSVSSYWLRDVLVLFVCHVFTLHKILFPLFFICFPGYLHLQQNGSYPNWWHAYLQKANQTFKKCYPLC